MTDVILESSLARQEPGSTFPVAHEKGSRVSLPDDEAKRFIERGLATAAAGKRAPEKAEAPTPETAAKPKAKARSKK